MIWAGINMFLSPQMELLQWLEARIATEKNKLSSSFMQKFTCCLVAKSWTDLFISETNCVCFWQQKEMRWLSSSKTTTGLPGYLIWLQSLSSWTGWTFPSKAAVGICSMWLVMLKLSNWRESSAKGELNWKITLISPPLISSWGSAFGKWGRLYLRKLWRILLSSSWKLL